MLSCYPSDTPKSFEFDKIVERLQGKCRCPMAREHASRMTACTDPEAIARLLEETLEFKDILFYRAAFPHEEFPDTAVEREKLAHSDGALEPGELHRLRKLIRAYGAVHGFLRADREKYERLWALCKGIEPEKLLIREIDKVIDEECRVRSDASPALVRIRKQIEAQHRELQKAFAAVLRRLRKDNLLAETNESVRGGRRVLAVHAEHKRRIQGILHDESDTGKTAFIEPEETVHLNNRRFELEREEQREILRILRELTARVRLEQDSLNDFDRLLGWLDFTRAKASLALQLDARAPDIAKQPGIVLKGACHPLLYLINSAQDKETVPLDLELNAEKRILVISGPNAGGKSVCLKTVGLIQLMFQAGMLVPVQEGTMLGIFDRLFSDIGDTQSLEDELSTYSARLVRMKNFLEGTDRRSLFLIDEFGTGTDPSLGGAVAEAILEGLRERAAIGVITTHYANLKVYAGQAEGLLNGAMRFDEKRLRPLFRLDTGRPGSSYTIAIARRIELPESVIARAEQIAGRSKLEFESLLVEVQGEEQELARRSVELRRREKELEQRIADYEAAHKRLVRQDKEEALKQKQRRDELLQHYEKRIAELMEGVSAEREALSQVERLAAREKALRHTGRELRQRRDKLSGEMRKLKKDLHYKPVEGAIEVGSQVKLIDTDRIGEVLELRGKQAVVAFNQLRTKVKMEDLILVEEKRTELPPAARPIRPAAAADGEAFAQDLDLRGKTREEATDELERFLDAALLRNLVQVRIIHGKGTGALRTAVRRVLKGYRAVSEVRTEDPKLGGDGVTVVRFE